MINILKKEWDKLGIISYKEEYPNLKRSQYIDMIQKEFKTSPENPIYLANIQKAKKAQDEEDEKE